jgi:hypothetical protein
MADSGPGGGAFESPESEMSSTELQAAAPSGASCWQKREHEGASDHTSKCPRTSHRVLDDKVVLDDTQRRVLEELVTCVDSQASIVITNPRAKGAARPS